MTWAKVDDKLHDHRKAHCAGKAAMGVWVMALSWAADNQTDGFVPARVLTRWGSPADAKKLVDAGLWDADEQDGEKGWRFHDWASYQPDARTLNLASEAKSKGGTWGNHTRWHLRRHVIDPECEHCTASRITENGEGVGVMSDRVAYPIATESDIREAISIGPNPPNPNPNPNPNKEGLRPSKLPRALRALASEDPYPTPCTPREAQARNVTTDRARGADADGGTR